ncbi:MAG: response regulator [bacterium]|jgi:signal transduction histidine kinase|nr:response regulator [candidate division KSB1 bacterium]MDH7559355.1 response regulator [bacterium]
MGHRVLFVDDEPHVLAALRRSLRKEPYELLCATSAAEALRLIATVPVDVVVSDEQMPGMSGSELLAEVRRRHPDTVRMMLSGKATLEGAIRAINDGAIYRFFIKPCDEVDLATTIRHALEHKDLVEENRRRAVELAEANKELESFNYTVSHDLRSPLQCIEGFAHALLEEYADRLDEQGRQYLLHLRAAAQRMSQLVSDLLQFSRSHRGELRYARVDLTAMAKQIAADLSFAHPERQVHFVVAEGMSAWADEGYLRVVLENLIGNAWKFTSKHQTATIEVGELREHRPPQADGQAVYFVRDDGAGFDQTYASKLFVPFQRLHSLSEFEGNGIGLATVQRIVVRHGGKVWAEGQVEQGATFYFTLPEREGSIEGETANTSRGRRSGRRGADHARLAPEQCAL